MTISVATFPGRARRWGAPPSLGDGQVASREWLDGYLNDHLAGATLALDLGEESQRRNEGTSLAHYLVTLVREIREDRETLNAVMEHLGIRPSSLKQATGWLAEKAARAKFQSPVGVPDVANRLLEVEALLMGIHGKQAMWETLDRFAHSEPRLASFDFAQLTSRAAHQLGALNARRLELLDRELSRA